jgi:sulfotransferase famil protein
MSSQQDDILVFLHVPKTAGTSLSSLFRAQFGKSAVFKLRNWQPDAHEAGEKEMRASIAALHALPVERRAGVRLAKGPLHYGFAPALPGRYFTLLRDPVKRVLSLYFQIRKPGSKHLPPEIMEQALKMSLREFIESGISLETDNDQTRRIAGVRSPGDLAVTAATLDRAARVLRHEYAAVGLTERFDESMLLFKRVFGWRTPFYERQNLNHQPADAACVSKADLALIAERNQFDIQLYQFARERFDEAVANLGASFRREVKKFQVFNRAFPAWRRMLRRSQACIDGLARRVPAVADWTRGYSDYLYQHHAIARTPSR